MPKRPIHKPESFFEKAEEAVEEKIEEVVEVAHPKKGFTEFRLKINPSNRWVQISIAVILILSIVAFVLAYKKYQDSTKLTGADGKLNSEAVRNLVSEVADKIVLPSNETPTIATVTDVTKLEDQPFFRNAKNGDKVLIYGSLRKAILYRPEIHKIIDVAPVNANLDQAANPSSAKPQTTNTTPAVTPSVTPVAQKLKVVIYNSTKKAGLAKKAGDMLDSQKTDIVKLGNASGEYKTTTVVNVSKIAKDADVKPLASSFSKVSPTFGSLPKGESAPSDADVVIILGQDFADSY